ncbi:putative MP24 [Trypanosoma conorhini]|uniref:Putative MP24 n=1 Tax=Trypanosoma conorhini TaxID=83891 RepID=A0A3R7LWG2_9TRYP|nr:putative MP24 [Trypanosoma conorhini]RNF04692.1 putative MP24 [Trypanosoma conorhini]
MHGPVMSLRANRPLLEKATITLRHAVEVAYASGLLGPPPRTLAGVPEAGAFAPHSVADPMGPRPEFSVGGGDGEHERTRDRILFASRCAEGASVAASSSTVSIAHLEGIVRRVVCGNLDGDVVLQLILEVAEGKERLPFAARWRPGSPEALQGLKGGKYVEEVNERLEGKRVLLSGRLQVEERYDAQSKMLHKVPVLMLLPTPSLEGSGLSFLGD